MVYATDRLARDPIHLAIIAEECDRAGAELIFVSEPLDASHRPVRTFWRVNEGLPPPPSPPVARFRPHVLGVVLRVPPPVLVQLTVHVFIAKIRELPRVAEAEIADAQHLRAAPTPG